MFLKGFNDIKVICDWASESEGPLEIKIVQELRIVGKNYGPLIYELDQNSDFDTYMSKIKQVHENFLKYPSMCTYIVIKNYFS